MINQIQQFLIANGYQYIPIDDDVIFQIYDLLINGNVNTEIEVTNNHNLLLYYGIYFDIKGNDAKTIEYYKKSSELGNIYAPYNLGIIYKLQGKEKEMKKYLKIAVDRLNVEAMHGLGNYYHAKKKIELMEKFYGFGVDHGHVKCMISLGEYYLKKDIKLDVMVGLFLKAVEKRSIYGVNNLVIHYTNIGDVENKIKYLKMGGEFGYLNSYVELGVHYEGVGDCDHMMENYMIAVNKGSVDAMFNLGCYYKKLGDVDNMEKYIMMCFDRGYDESIFELIDYYRNDKEKYLKYNIMGLMNDECVDNINKYLADEFDVTVAQICKRKLSDVIRDRFATFLANC